MIDTIAVDFGAYRTKVAFRDSQEQFIDVAVVGTEGERCQPSIFYLGTDKSRFFGADAVNLLDHDPDACLSRPIKGEPWTGRLYADNGESADPLDLLVLSLQTILSKVPNLPSLDVICLALPIPREYGANKKEMLLTAASTVGFIPEKIAFVEDPVAAVQGWEYWKPEERQDTLVVVDCGGGSMRWTCVTRSREGRFEVIPELAGEARPELGLSSIDEKIMAEVLADRNEGAALMRSKFPNIRDQFFRSGDGQNVIIQDDISHLKPDTFIQLREEKYISPACLHLEAFLKQVQSFTAKVQTPLLLVGGGSVYLPFRTALSTRCQTNVIWRDFLEFAEVLGALVPGENQVPMEITRAKTEWCDQIRASIDRALPEAIP